MSDRPKISLDLEGVLADVNGYFIDHYNLNYGKEFTRNDITHWEWVREQELDFLEYTRELWHKHWMDIPACESRIWEPVYLLSQIADVDIVTARQGATKPMESWVDYHKIKDFGEFRVVNESKANLKEYDFFIDDKPGLPDKLTPPRKQFLIKKSLNRSVWDHPNVIPVATIREAFWKLNER